MAIRVVSGNNSPRSAVSSSLFPPTNATTGYRPATSPNPASHSSNLLSSTGSAAGGGGILSPTSGYRQPHMSSVSAQNSPRAANSSSPCGPRVGATLLMTKVDLVADPHAAQTITVLKSAAAAAAQGGMGYSSSHRSAANPSKATTSASNISNGIHIVIPAPPPSWSGGSPSSIIQRAFAGGDDKGPANAHCMVSVTESPYYTHQSLKAVQKHNEAMLSEATTRQMHRSGDEAKAKIIQSTIPSPAGKTATSGPKSVVIVPLTVSDLEPSKPAAANNSTIRSAEGNNGRSTPPSPRGGTGQPVGTTTIWPMAIDKRIGAPTVNIQGAEAATESRRNLGGVAVIEVPVEGIAGNPLAEGRPGITLPTQAEELYRSEVLVTEAVKQAEASAHIYNDPSYNIGLTARRRQQQLMAANASKAGRAGSLKPQQQPAAAEHSTPINLMGIGEDLGRDKILSSSTRFGNHSEELQRAAAQSQQRVGFAMEMATTLGASPAQPTSPNQLRIPAPPAFFSPNTTAQRTITSEDIAGEDGGQRSVVAFGIATPRFGPNTVNKNERIPPVGHYNVKYSRTETQFIRDVYFSGHGVPYDQIVLNKSSSSHKPSPLSIADVDAADPTKRFEMPPPSPNMTHTERADYEKKKAILEAQARAKLSPRQLSKLRAKEEAEAKAMAPPKKSLVYMSSLPRLQTSPRRDAEIVNATSIGNTVYGDFNEAAISTSPRSRCGVNMDKVGNGREGRSGWDRRPDIASMPPTRETNYTGTVFGDKRDSSNTPRGYMDMDRQVGRGMPMHSHLADQQATGGTQLQPGQSAPLNSLDLQELPAGDINVTGKYPSQTGTKHTATMSKQSPRQFHVKPATNVSSDERPDVLSLQFAGSSATKAPRPPVAFVKQTSRPDPSYKSACAVETYDTEYDDGKGNITSSLQGKIAATSPRTRQTDFNRMGSHSDYNSFAKDAERRKLHDAGVGMGDAAVQFGFVHTRPRTLKNVDFTNLAPRKDDTRHVTDSSADPDKMYPKEILHDRLGGDPFMSSHASRETARKAKAIKPARTTDNFYDIPEGVGYTGEHCKSPPNAVNISRNPGRDAHGHHRTNNASHLGSAHTGNTYNGAANSKSASPLRQDANLGPGEYDFNVQVLSRPLPGLSFKKQVILPDPTN